MCDLWVGSDCCVTVFGFGSNLLPNILSIFSALGEIINFKAKDGTNWACLLFKNKSQAKTALSKNGIILNANVMIGVMPCTPESHNIIKEEQYDDPLVFTVKQEPEDDDEEAADFTDETPEDGYAEGNDVGISENFKQESCPLPDVLDEDSGGLQIPLSQTSMMDVLAEGSGNLQIPLSQKSVVKGMSKCAKKLDAHSVCLPEFPLAAVDTASAAADCLEAGNRCEDCGHCFRMKADLKKHYLFVHAKVKDFVCEQCGRKFSKRNNLNKHISGVHLRDRPHHCEICGKRFFEKAKLNSHVLYIHSNSDCRFQKKPYLCDLCGSKFNQPGQLRSHVSEVHERIREFVCDLCGRKFSRKSNVKKHVQAVHRGERPYECEQCGKKYSERGKMRAHVLQVHNIVTGQDTGGGTS